MRSSLRSTAHCDCPAHTAHSRPSALCPTPRQAHRSAPCGSCFARLPFPLCCRKSRSAAQPGSPTHCFLCCLVGAHVSRLSRLLSHRSMFCASHRTVVMALAKSWQKLDLPVPRRLRNPVTGRGHHVTPGGRGFLGDRAKQPRALSRTLSRALNTTVPTVTPDR